jgi:HTH-type transcriptional regulator / antitoxin HipB
LERQRRNLSQRDLAEKAQITQAALSRIEHGVDIRLSTLTELTRVLGLELILVPKELIGSIEYMISNKGKSSLEEELPPRFMGVAGEE